MTGMVDRQVRRTMIAWEGTIPITLGITLGAALQIHWTQQGLFWLPLSGLLGSIGPTTDLQAAMVLHTVSLADSICLPALVFLLARAVQAGPSNWQLRQSWFVWGPLATAGSIFLLETAGHIPAILSDTPPHQQPASLFQKITDCGNWLIAFTWMATGLCLTLILPRNGRYVFLQSLLFTILALSGATVLMTDYDSSLLSGPAGDELPILQMVLQQRLIWLLPGIFSGFFLLRRLPGAFLGPQSVQAGIRRYDHYALAPVTPAPQESAPDKLAAGISGPLETRQTDQDDAPSGLSRFRQTACLLLPVPPHGNPASPGVTDQAPVIGQIGGLPRLPADMPWPETRHSELELLAYDHPPRALSFLAQVDLAALARAGLDQTDLPERGSLYFFFDYGSYLGLTHDRFDNWVLYNPEPAGRLSPRMPPDNLQPFYGPDAEFFWRWLRNRPEGHRGYPVTTPEWHIHAKPADAFQCNESTEHPFPDKVRQALTDELEAAGRSSAPPAMPGNQETGTLPPVPLTEAIHDPHPLSQLPGTDFHKDRFRVNARVWHPPGDFPAAWISIEIFCGCLRNRLLDALPLKRRRLADGSYWPENPAGVARGYRSLLQEAGIWMTHAQEMGLFNPVDSGERAAFMEWLERTDSARPMDRNSYFNDLRSAYGLYPSLRSAFCVGTGHCLSHSAKTAAMISPEAFDMVERYFQPASPHGHSLLGNFMVNEKPEGCRSDDWILLAQFTTDTARCWRFAEQGALQYWIRRQDLSAGIFSGVRVSLHPGPAHSRQERSKRL